jgi:hypothetical protein
MQQVTISLIVSIVTLSLAVFFLSLGEFSNSLIKTSTGYFGYFESCDGKTCTRSGLNTSLVLVTIGFILELHSVAFSIICLVLQRRIPRTDQFKLLLIILGYNALALIFMIVGWHELKVLIIKASTGWSYALLIVGFSFSIVSFIPIIFTIFKSYK